MPVPSCGGVFRELLAYRGGDVVPRFHDDGRLEELAAPANLQASCLQIGFYLASWGMFRNSPLLDKSSRFYEPLVRSIAAAERSLWTLDVPQYGDESCALIMQRAEDIRSALFPEASDTLVTKVMLGVFGCVPAFDSYFVRGFRHAFGKGSLLRLRAVYEADASSFDACCVPTIDFTSRWRPPPWRSS